MSYVISFAQRLGQPEPDFPAIGCTPGLYVFFLTPYSGNDGMSILNATAIIQSMVAVKMVFNFGANIVLSNTKTFM